MDIPWDQVRCVLTAHRDVVGETVRVDARVTLAGVDATEFRDVVRKALGGALDGKWDLKSVNRKEDSSGMEHMVVTATTRVPEHRTAGLADRLRSASRAGLRLELDHIHYRPPSAEIKKALAELRQEVYRLAQLEADQLNKQLPAEILPWRVAVVDVSEEEKDQEKLRREFLQRQAMSVKRSLTMQEDLMGDEPDFRASFRVQVTAKVTLRRLSLPLPPETFFSGQSASDK